ncbi:unnamed protein product [Symbiodinium sp. KB8]|nr:unnamed protein product [Symbiodinium sp. KB8]
MSEEIDCEAMELVEQEEEEEESKDVDGFAQKLHGMIPALYHLHSLITLDRTELLLKLRSIVGNLELYIPEDGVELVEVRSTIETFRELYAELQSSLAPTPETQGIWQSVLCSCRDVEAEEESQEDTGSNVEAEALGEEQQEQNCADLLLGGEVKHSVTAMSKAVMDGCEPLTVQGMERKELKNLSLPEHTVYFRGSRCCRLFSCLRFTILPVKKTHWPLAQVVGFVEEFMDMAKPNMQELCRRVGVSRCTTSRNLYQFLLEKEALQGYTRMSSLKLSGVLEGDGTCLKLFKRAGSNFHVALWGLVQRPTSQEVPKMLVYIVPVKKTAHNAVCPVESREDILQTKALEQILPTVKGDREMASVLLTDGAKVYNKLAKAYGLQHKFVVHSKSEWSKTESAGSHGRQRVNTGLIDERWKCIKGYVPVSLSGGSRDDSETSFSPHLFNYLYSWWLRSQECRPAWSPHQLRAGAMHRAGIVAAEAAESDGVTSSDHALALSTSPEHMSEDNLVDFSDRSEESMEAAPVNVVASTSAGRDRSEENMEAAPVHVVASTGERQPPLSATLTAAAGRRRRAFKWGCHIHEKEILKNGTAVRRALCPHIFRSGRNQGQLWLLCSDWWRQRRCWHKESFDMSRFKELPTWQQDCLDADTRMRKP